MGKKYYAVRVGVTPGVYESWEICRQMVEGYPGAKYKSFPTMEEAEAFAGTSSHFRAPEKTGAHFKASEGTDPHFKTDSGEPDGPSPDSYAFVDGSFNVSTNTYGYGGFLVSDGVKYVLTGCGEDPEMASMRNVAGEVLGSMAAMEKALELGLRKLTIYYDYLGIEMWAKGLWKRNKAGTIAYYNYVRSLEEKLSLEFVKIKGHSGVEGNEEADRLAKSAVGIEVKA